MTEFLLDNTFENSFILIRRKAGSLTEIEKLPLNSDAKWNLCEWGTRHSLFEDRRLVEKEGDYEISNISKSVKREKDGSLTLSIETDKEYLAPRKEGEDWPHLLFEQHFENKFLRQYRSLNLDFSLSFLALEDHMKERNDSHTLQVSLYFEVGNAEDFFWFGLPFIDAPRYRKPRKWVNEDGGKADASHKLIYALDPSIYIKELFLVGDTVSFELDLLPFMLEAFRVGKEAGYLKNVKEEELRINGLNFGFESTGTFSSKIRINRLSIKEEKI